MSPRARHILLSLVACWIAISSAILRAAESLDYALPDPALKVVRLDSAPTESFLAVKADTTGRLFVGGRTGLFVYEPDQNGGYGPRQELLTFPDHTWVYDIEIRGDDVYLLTVSALYVVPDGRVKREGLQARRLIWGVPMGHVHQCFHGMTWGPEGDLYFSMGDPLTYYGDFNRPDHWGYWTFFSRKQEPTSPPLRKGGEGGVAPKPDGATARDNSPASKSTPAGEAGRGSQRRAPSPPPPPLAKGGSDPARADADTVDWVRTPYNGVGGVFRCRPDGSGFQVVATGLRNCCGLAFDRDWNLFTNDNDHESLPADYVPGRLVHVTPHSYHSWPRGWMPSKTPDRLDLLDTMNTNLGRFVPVGQSYYDDTYLPEKYRNSLLVARWCTRQITFYPLKPFGATFKCDEHELLAGRDLARPVHVTVGRGGRIFATICYMAHNEGSPVYKSDLVMITRADDSEKHPFDAYDAPTATAEKLFNELENPSWSRRKAAHVEILRRGGKLLDEAVNRLDATAPPMKLKQLAWLAGAAGSNDARTRLAKLQTHSDSDVRLQVVRAVSEFSHAPTLEINLNRPESTPSLKLAGLAALFRPDRTIDWKSRDASIVQLASDGDGYIRQTAALLMAERAPVDHLGNLLQSGTAKERLAAVLAAGFRLTMPPVTQELHADLPLAPWRNLEEAMKIHFIDGDLDLRSMGRSGLYTVAEHWKAGKHTEEQEQLFALVAARLGDEDEKVRLQAGYFLSLLNDDRTEPVIARVRTDIQKSRLATAPMSTVTNLWALGPFVDGQRGLTAPHPPENGPFDSAARFPASDGQRIGWKEIKRWSNRLFDFRDALRVGAGTSCYAFARIESGTRQPIELLTGTDAGFKVWLNGRMIIRSDAERGALPFQDAIPLELQPGSNDLLIRVRNGADACRLYLHYRSLQPVAFVLPEPLAGGTLAERLRDAAANPDQSRVDAKFLNVNWDDAAKAGDLEKGKRLFSADGLGCAKCHAVSNDAAVTGGPSLAEAAKRFTVAHLVESVLLPNKTISPVFKATAITTKQGKTHVGLVVNDTADKVEMILTDTNRVTIPAAEIEERKLQETSPMPAGLVKTPDELRDLLAYLLRAN